MMLKQITNEAQKLVMKVRKSNQFVDKIQESEPPEQNHPLSKTNFPCIYCFPENLQEYHAYRKIVGLNPYSNTWQPVPYLTNWTEFKLHMLCEHPDQWGRSEEDTIGVQRPRSWSNTQGIADRKRVKNIYLNIRAWPEYGWNFFLHIQGEPLWTGKSLNPTLLGLPEDENIITGIKWASRKNPNTNELWNKYGDDTSWLYERESRTHTRAQNAVGPQLNRGINAIRRILRGTKTTKINLQDGCVLVKGERDTHEVGKVPFHKLYTANCLLHKRGLSALESIRRVFQLNGPGNSGQLQALEKWKKCGIPYLIEPNGVIVNDFKTQQANIKTNEVNTNEKEIIVDTTVPDEIEIVPITTNETSQQIEDTATIDLDNLIEQLTRIIPTTEYYLNILNDVQAVFTYTRKLQDSMNDDTILEQQQLRERIEEMSKERNTTIGKLKQDLDAVHSTLRAEIDARNIAEGNLKAYANQHDYLTTKITQLQQQLDAHPTPKQQIAAVSQHTVNQLSKPKNVTVV